MSTTTKEPKLADGLIIPPGLDEDIAALFSLNPDAEPTADLLGSGDTSGNCTDNGCTSTCRNC